ncbi:19671_t:CDS:10 [Funneliformis geosporum]|uniref:19671_t:CDS:1 n=1 Tax=Funneliformis geosporum TaxID=1117311 RepID=A0A9W4X399_9GLOM|nr:19671_t:CDS:10 [Funneliformis geosporum]
MTKPNPILENLQNRVVQELPIKSIYADNDFAIFDKGASEFYGSEDEFITDQPLEGALQGPAQQALLIDRLIDSMKTKAITTLNRKIVEIITDKDNYNANAWQEISKEEATVDSLDKAIVILKKIKIQTNCETRRSKVLTIDPDFLDDLEIYFLCDVVRDSELNPHKIFKKVIPKKLAQGVIATIHDEKSVVYRIINPEEIQHEKTLGGGMEKFAYHVEVGGDNSSQIKKLEDQERQALQQDIYQLENSTDLKLLNQAQDKQKELQEALDNIIALLGKEEIKNLKDIRKLLAGKSLKELINTNALYSQKITDLENSLLALGKSKLKGKQEYLKLEKQELMEEHKKALADLATHHQTQQKEQGKQIRELTFKLDQQKIQHNQDIKTLSLQKSTIEINFTHFKEEQAQQLTYLKELLNLPTATFSDLAERIKPFVRLEKEVKLLVRQEKQLTANQQLAQEIKGMVDSPLTTSGEYRCSGYGYFPTIPHEAAHASPEDEEEETDMMTFEEVNKTNFIITVDLINYQENDLGDYDNLEIQFKSGKKQRTKPANYEEPTEPDKKEIFLKSEEIILFFNNSTKTPNLLDAETIYLEDLRVYGIRHLTSKKEERQNNPEIELNEAQFIALERDKRREREKSIEEFENKGENCQYEPVGEEIIEIEEFEEPNTDYIECGTDLDDDLPETDDSEETMEDNPDIIYCYDKRN